MEPTYKRFGARMAMALVLVVVALASMTMAHDERRDRDGQRAPDTLYVWAGDQARVAPDFLAVIDFDEDSPRYGRVISTVPVPGARQRPATSRTTVISRPTRTSSPAAGCSRCCAGRTASSSSMSRRPRHPKFLFSTSGTLSNITDDFLPLKDGGFLVTQMGDAHRRHARSRRRVRRRPADGRGMADGSAGSTTSTRTASRPVPIST